MTQLTPELKQKLQSIQLIVLDVDGVLTDGAIILAGSDSDTKAFHVQDGFGVTLARQAGIRFGILTGRISEAVSRRVKELRIDYYECGHFYKQEALREMIKTAGLTAEQVLYMGDDVLDLVCKPVVGVFVAPANATTRVRQEAHWVTQRKGGDTAVREMIDTLLNVQGLLTATEDYFIGAKL
ncbi:MAG: 3-deoxy-D-manno-octulosonate 8-phosphate phosphatase [Gammaproteobacteria bacterium]|nr:3-deoxy-D-manno-octulosonate 8-phosphate phosphatase [Gammaproteobacteria bacterium]